MSSNEWAGDRFLTEYEGGKILKEFGLPIVPSQLAKNEDEAVQIAKSMNYPVVLKGVSPDIVHKTEAKIVKINIENERQLREEYKAIRNNVYKYKGGAQLDGILVQKMIPKGIELIVGVKRDSIFGHQLLLGVGGIFVEILKDFSIKMMPVTEGEVEEMVNNLKASPLLQGYRGGEKINMHQLNSIIKKLNSLVQSHPNIEEMDLNPIIFHKDQAFICDVRVYLSQTKNPQVLGDRSLEGINKMINPQSIAVFGASTNPKKSGARLFKYIVENGFEGELYPIHPKAEKIQGYKVYNNINKVPNDVDLACIIVAAKHVPNVLKDCIKKGVKAAIIYSSGFAEAGSEGRKLQDEIYKLSVEGNMRLCGPNSIGIASPSENTYTAFGSALEAENKFKGNIGFVSQSGAMGSALLSRAWEEGAGFSRWISVGNEADLTISDFIKILAEDNKTKVISVFMEGIKDVNLLQRAAKKAIANKKPILVYKTGKSTVGKRAVQSHTGAIAGDDRVYSAVFEKFGIMRAEHIEDLIDASRAFEIQPLPKGKNIGILTASGGACSVIADLCEKYDLDVPELSEDANNLREIIPPFGSSINPVDVTAEVIANPEMFRNVLRIMSEDKNIDGLIVMLTTNADPGASIIAEAILDEFDKYSKPIVLGRLGANSIAPRAMELYRKHRFPVYPTPERAVRVMHYLTKFSRMLTNK